MANPYLAALIATWRRQKKNRAPVVSAPRSKPETDIWGPPLKPRTPPTAPPGATETPKS